MALIRIVEFNVFGNPPTCLINKLLANDQLNLLSKEKENVSVLDSQGALNSRFLFHSICNSRGGGSCQGIDAQFFFVR